ncbi:hypothetical protein IHE55_08525 [Streptomyces pactum]|uniref:Uncharacterized protein n=1 Tax=Streptomyces pactum TaxID=68249 RepID=A0ABS0NHZ9_9ACTN|nr:hypothetical protein [Streptomyces pactum]MBH5334837.1 hypothetical protein [Streptomyces pactum]
MSYNQPPPPSGPYPGGQPGPYDGTPAQPPADAPGSFGAPPPAGAPGASGGQPGYGYPQPGYGYPSAPPAGFGQAPQPVPPQPGYGYPQAPGPYGQGAGAPSGPVPPAPRKDRTKVIAISSAAVVVIAAAVVGAVVLSGGGNDTEAMKLVPPKSLGSEVYELDEGPLKDETAEAQRGMPEGATSVLARYTRTDDPRSGLSFSGMYGEFSAPEKVRDAMFKGYPEGNDEAELIGERKTFQPDGADGPSVECQGAKLYGTYYAAVCAWAEETDAGMVVNLDADVTAEEDLDLNGGAKLAAELYRDGRKPA